MIMAEKQEATFEASLAQLETVVAEMESGQLSLEASMKRFEEGMKLAKFCEKKLGETERKIEVLMQGEGGQAEWGQLPLSEDSGKD